MAYASQDTAGRTRYRLLLRIGTGVMSRSYILYSALVCVIYLVCIFTFTSAMTIIALFVAASVLLIAGAGVFASAMWNGSTTGFRISFRDGKWERKWLKEKQSGKDQQTN